MLKWIIAALAFFGITHTATAPSKTSSGTTQPSRTAPAHPSPVHPECTDGQPYPPLGC